LDILNAKPHIISEHCSQEDYNIIKSEGIDRLRLFLIYLLCAREEEIADNFEEMKNALLRNYSDICLDSVYYIINKKVNKTN